MSEDEKKGKSGFEASLQEAMANYREPVDPAVWQGVMAGMAPKQKRRAIVWWWWGAAASLLLLLGAGTLWWSQGTQSGQMLAEQTATEKTAPTEESSKGKLDRSENEVPLILDGSASENQVKEDGATDEQAAGLTASKANTDLALTSTNAKELTRKLEGQAASQDLPATATEEEPAPVIAANSPSNPKTGTRNSDGLSTNPNAAFGAPKQRDAGLASTSNDRSGNAGDLKDTKVDAIPYRVAFLDVVPDLPQQLEATDLAVSPFSKKSRKKVGRSSSTWLLAAAVGTMQTQSSTGSRSPSFSTQGLATGNPVVNSNDELGYLSEDASVPEEIVERVVLLPKPEEDYTGSVTAAFTVQYFLLPRLSVETGLLHTSHQFSSKVVYLNDFGERVHLESNFSDRYLGAPLQLNYYFLQSKRFNGYVGGGLALEFGYSRRVSNTSSPDDAWVVSESSSSLDDFNLLTPVGLGLGYNLGRYFSLYAQPGLTFFVPGFEPEGIGNLEVDALQPNFRTGLRFHF